MATVAALDLFSSGRESGFLVLLGGLVVVGLQPFDLDDTPSAIGTTVAVPVVVALAVIAFAKGRLLLGAISIFIPPRRGARHAHPRRDRWYAGQKCLTSEPSPRSVARAVSVSHISQAYPDRVEVRGRDLTGDLMGRLSFTEYFHLLLTGQEPTPDQRDFLDVLLVAIAEHGMMPTNVAARMTLAADPGSLQGAVAAGILGCGPVLLGTSEECARLLASGRDPREAVREIRAAGGKVPGFGHPVHKPLDPRAERILQLADERGVSGVNVALARAYREAVHEVWGKPLTMNVSMPIAAVMLDLGFPPATVKAVPILARTAGLLAHLAEEQQQPLGLLMAGSAEAAIEYERG